MSLMNRLKSRVDKIRSEKEVDTDLGYEELSEAAMSRVGELVVGAGWGEICWGKESTPGFCG